MLKRYFYSLPLLASIVLLFFSLATPTLAATAHQLTVEDTSGVTSISSTDTTNFDAALDAITTGVRGIYWIGTFTPPPYDNTTGPTDDWSWTGGYNNLFNTAESVNITDSDIPHDADNEWMCASYLLENGVTFKKFSDSGYDDFCIHFQWNGTSMEGSNAVPVIQPTGDGDNTTHVIRITSPTLYATTTPNFEVDFDANINGLDSSIDGYNFAFSNDGTGQILNYYGLLPSYATNTPFTVASTSVNLPTDSGAWTLNVTLGSNTGGKIANSGAVWGGNGVTTSTHFAVGSVYSSSLNYTTAGYGGNTYASSSCAVNFLGTFDLPDCIGYLVTPSSSTLQDFSQIGLQNKFPFVYAYQMGAIRQALFTATGTATTSIGVSFPVNGNTWHLTFLSESMIASVPFTPWLKTLLDALLWVMLAELIYYQVLRSHNKET
jgi:hypothetical protein